MLELIVYNISRHTLFLYPWKNDILTNAHNSLLENLSSVSKSLFLSSVTKQHLLPGVKVWYVTFALISASTEVQMECWASLRCLCNTH